MAEASSLMSTRAVQIRAPPSLTSCIDVVNRATAPYHNEKPIRGAIMSFDFKYPSNIFFVEQEPKPKFDLNFLIRIEDEYHAPIEIQAAAANHFNVDNNIAELLNESTNFFPTCTVNNLNFHNGTVNGLMQSPDDYCNWGDNNVRFVVLSNVYPSNIDVSVSLSTREGGHQLRRAFVGASRPYTVSYPSDEKLCKLLCWTAGLGYINLFKAYLDQIPAGLEMEDAFGMTPFSWAAQNGEAKVVRLALQQAGSICARRRTSQGPAPLEAAACSQDIDIFESFLKWLKYLENPIAINLTPELSEIPEHGPDLVDEDIEREIRSAGRSEQTVTVRKLVEILRDRQGEKLEQDKWLANRIVKAAKKGDLSLVRVLRACGAQVNCENDDNVTPLIGAINSQQTKIAEYLIFQSAKDDNTSSALRQAVATGQHSTIRALLKVGPPLKESLKQDLLRIAGEKRDSTTLMLLSGEKGTEKLATREDLDEDVDKLFHATVVDFYEDQSPQFTEHTVHKLLHESEELFNLDEKSNFKWFHLPANNMKWAEVLISKIYYKDPSLAYKVLAPKRWIKRQHEGENGSSHARFMMSACHDFQEAFDDKKKNARENEDRHVVLFMPYLHWDDEVSMQKRSEFLEPHSEAVTSKTAANVQSPNNAAPPPPNPETQNGPHESIFQRERMLIEKYLLSELRCDKNSRHLLHVRRTLDQSLYHNLKDTKIRDADQTVRRYQRMLYSGKKTDEVSFAVIMVDQLWLWILVGPSGKAQAVVTCFPSRDWPNDNKDSSSRIHVLDPQRTTDILQTTKSYIQQRPNAVKTPYDLAGVIASRCSRALLDHSTDMLDFTEVYENSISYIMNEEVLLFNTFNGLMQTRTRAMENLNSNLANEEANKITIKSSLATDTVEKFEAPRSGRDKTDNEKSPSLSNEGAKHREIDSRLAMDIVQEIKALRSGEKTIGDIKKRCQEYLNYAQFTEIPNEIEMKGPKEKLGNENEHHAQLLAKFGRFFVLDITREIFLLRQIKDIQDELEMMSKVFAEQMEVIEAMDRIIRAMIRPKLDPDDNEETSTSIAESNSIRDFDILKQGRECNGGVYNIFVQHRRSNTGISELTNDFSSTSGEDDLFAYAPLRYLHRDTQKKKDLKKQSQSIIWQFRHQKQNLPLRTVDRFAKLIKTMNERAKNTNKALTNLVDLKQKQSNMIDTRTTRLQAEESQKMAKESEKQSRTLMIFTIVTIVFLPLSFIAAFFAIPVKEFNDITLDFVSMITFPVSAATSLLIIVIGYAASKWEWISENLKPKVFEWLSKDVKPTNGNQRTRKQSEISAQEESQETSTRSSSTNQKANDSIV